MAMRRPTKNKKRKKSIFDKTTIAIAGLIVAGIGAALISIVIKGLPNLRESVFSKEVVFAMRLSLYTATMSTGICMILAIPTAYALTKTNMPLKKLSGMIIELPLSLPYLVLGLSLLIIFSSHPGKWLSEMGFRVIFSRNGIIAAHILVNLPFVIRILRIAFEGVDGRLELIARMLGATKAQSFWTITLPLAKHTILGAAILAWSRALGEFGATLMLVGATRMKTETLPASIYLNMATGEIGSAMASAVILLSISVASLLVFNSMSPSEKEMRIGVKELG